MAVYTATISWMRGEQAFADNLYSRAHEISLDGGVSFPGSASPHVVKAPLSRLDAADPEELLVASLSACHMLWFLDFARRGGFVVDSYIDNPEGVMGKNAAGKIAMTKVTLKPAIEFAGEKRPSAADLAELHHKSHEACFIANSFSGEVSIAT